MSTIKEAIYKLLNKIAFKAISQKIFGLVVGGFKGFVLGILVDKVFDKAVEPFLNLCLRKGLLKYDKTVGTLKFKRFKKAKDSGNETDYNSSIDNL